MTEFLVNIGGEWQEMKLLDLLDIANTGVQFSSSDEFRVYTGVKDINGAKIFDKDKVVEYGHYVNSDKLMTQEISFKPNHGAWLRGDYQRLTPKNVKLYKIEVMKR